MKCEFQHHYYPLRRSLKDLRLNLKLQRHHDKKSYYSQDDCDGEIVTADGFDDARDDDDGGCDDDCENGVFHWLLLSLQMLCYVVSLCYDASDRHDHRHLCWRHLHYYLHAADDY